MLTGDGFGFVQSFTMHDIQYMLINTRAKHGAINTDRGAQ
jgi:hypothetical protein